MTIGEIMGVLYPEEPISMNESTRFIKNIGGAEANFAFAASANGCIVRFITRLGDDSFGQNIFGKLKAAEIDCSAVTLDSNYQTGILFREWLPDGLRRVNYYRKGSAASYLSPADIPDDILKDAQMVHLTGITPALSEGCHQAVIALAHKAVAAKVPISFDPNYRRKLWNEAEAQRVLLPLIPLSEILVIGHEDGAALFGTEDQDEMVRKAKAHGAKTMILKRGVDGCRLVTKDTDEVFMPHQAKRSIDPVGAGDAFDAGFISEFVKGSSREICMNRALAFGARAVEDLGDSPFIPR